MELRGRVTSKVLHKGTKSEHKGLVLMSLEGEFKLRRRGGNPFQDEILASLEGREIKGEGIVKKNQFIMSAWEVVD